MLLCVIMVQLEDVAACTVLARSALLKIHWVSSPYGHFQPGVICSRVSDLLLLFFSTYTGQETSVCMCRSSESLTASSVSWLHKMKYDACVVATNLSKYLDGVLLCGVVLQIVLFSFFEQCTIIMQTSLAGKTNLVNATFQPQLIQSRHLIKLLGQKCEGGMSAQGRLLKLLCMQTTVRTCFSSIVRKRTHRYGI